jgi:glutamate synthase (NADPH/NADH) small chain
MADRYLQSLEHPPREAVPVGNVHDADSGPEGPPRHADGALSVER